MLHLWRDSYKALKVVGVDAPTSIEDNEVEEFDNELIV